MSKSGKEEQEAKIHKQISKHSTATNVAKVLMQKVYIHVTNREARMMGGDPPKKAIIVGKKFHAEY